jgi:hypothetical protein
VFESPTPDKYPFTQPPGWGLSLPAIYGFWWLVVLMLWPICRWYAGIKQERPRWWMSYL